MRVVDDVVLAALKEIGVAVHDSEVTVDTTTKVVKVGLPYAAYHSSIGDDADPRLDGRNTIRTPYFSITYVGEDRNQAKALGEKIRNALEGRRFAISGRRAWLCRLDESTRVFRADDAIRPDGRPLFYGVDSYSLPVTIVRSNA